LSISSITEPIIIVFGFWNVVTYKLLLPLPWAHRIVLDYMYKRVDENYIKARCKDFGVPYNYFNLQKIIKHNGQSIILEAAGDYDFVYHLKDTIKKLHELIPNVKIGLMVDDIPQLNAALEDVELFGTRTDEILDGAEQSYQLDFIINSCLVSKDEAQPHIFEELREILGNHKILVVGTADIKPTVENLDTIQYNNWLANKTLYETIIDYVSN
jgi:hypothetical protein